KARIVARDMAFPNGTVITPDNRTLIVGESRGACLTAFDIESDGSLVNRRVWADLFPATPDGICLDTEGCIWVASPHTAEVLRFREGGFITHRVRVTTRPYACMLGGHDGKTLFVCTSGALPWNSGRIETIRVEYAGAGFP
nr:SMP-30/gluconolactonase/LRE family protein [Syntrophales bacterium]